MAAGLESIDWRAPWLAPWAAAGERVADLVAQGLPLHEALNQVNATRPFGDAAAPIRFVAQTELPPRQAYEQFVADTGNCPVRPGQHDLFNGLCWMRFPLAKARLNALQAAQIAASGITGARGPVRDALTLLDENAALLEAPQPLRDALAARQWKRLFVELRPLWQQASLLLFGHALLEKLVMPRKAITAHVYLLQPGIASLAAADEWLAADLTAPRLAAKPFLPLPVLGVPGWCEANRDPDFYADASVFRAAAQFRRPGVA